MTTLEFLRRILPSSGAYLLGYPSGKVVNGKELFYHDGYDTLEEMAADIPRLAQEKKAVYHACAAYISKPYKDENGRWVSRKGTNARACKSFWVDLDCDPEKAKKGLGYNTKKEAFQDLWNFCKKYEIDFPMVVSSGYGLHVYWPLATELSAREWIPVAGVLKAALFNAGVKQDPNRTADIASVLRPIGTFNKKYGGCRTVELKVDCEPIETSRFLAQINNLVFKLPTNNVRAIGGLDEEIPEFLRGQQSQSTEIPDYSAYPQFDYSPDLIADKCKAMRTVRDTQGDCDFTHWRGAIGVLKFCKDGLQKAEEWTAKRHEKHQKFDWQYQYDSWNSGPATCDYFRMNAPIFCEGCEHAQKVKSPLLLGRDVPKEASETRIVEVQAPAEESQISEAQELKRAEICPEGYDWKNGYLTKYYKTEDEVVAIPFSQTRFYLSARLLDEQKLSSVIITKYSASGKKSEFELDAKYVGTGGTQLLGMLGMHEIVSTTNKGAESAMCAYLKDSLSALKMKIGVTRSFVSFGWQDEQKSFLLGDQLYMKGKKDTALLRKHALSKAKLYPKPKGTLEGYSEALNWVYARKGMEPMQYAICSLWGAPLACMIDSMYKGIPCALTGADSGKGKTTAFTAALYAFGDADKMTIKSSRGATPNARMAMMGTVSNLPILFDEVTNISATQLSDLAYALSNGGEMERLTVAKGVGGTMFAESGSWNTQTGMTGNTDFTALLAGKGNSEAETMRLFEIHVDEYDIPKLSPIEVAMKLEQMKDNAGCAGHKYIEYLVNNHEDVMDTLLSTAKAISEDSLLSSEPKYRFYRYHAICTIAAARIMSKLGVHEFPIPALTKFAQDSIEQLCEASRELHEKDPLDLLEELISFFQDRILTTPTFDGCPAPVRLMPGGIVGRAITGVHGKWSPEDNILYLKREAIQQWCLANRVSHRKFLAKLAQTGVVEKFAKQRILTKGVPNATSIRSWVYRIHLDKAGIDLPTEDENAETNR